MATTKLRFNGGALRAIMKSDKACKIVHQEAVRLRDKANAKCGDDNMRGTPYMVYDRVGNVSAHSFVFIATPHGANAEARNHILENILK